MDWGGASAAQMDAEPPSLIGALVADRYRVESLLGSGSTGDVYLCTHTGLDKVVALKILHADMVKHENFVERFKREARAASKLEHPNSVRVLDFGEDPNGILYIAMEYIAGRDLWTLLDEEWPLDNKRIVEIMSQVLGALGKAHSLGIVHRDLKPENIMVRSSGSDEGDRDVVTVCDFGIAQLSPIQLSGSFSPFSPPTVTGDGMVVGTPAYMSPEQARAEPLDARSDVYSAGVVLFQMLTRQLPFTAETPLAVAVMHCSTPPPMPSQLALVHPALEAVCLRALSKMKEARYQSAKDMQLALQAAVAATAAQLERPRKRRPYLPLSAPPLVMPPAKIKPARAKEKAQPSERVPPPASLAPFELTAEQSQERVRAKSRTPWLIGGAVTLALTAFTVLPKLFDRVNDSAPDLAADADGTPANDSQLGHGASASADTTTAGAPLVERGQAVTPVQPEPAAPSVQGNDNGIDVAPIQETNVPPLPELAMSNARAARTDRAARADRDVPRGKLAVARPARDAVAAPSPKNRSAGENKDETELSIPTLRVSTAAGPAAPGFDPGKPKAAPLPEVAAKQAPAVAIVPEDNSSADVRSVDSEPEIPVGMVELPNHVGAPSSSADGKSTTATLSGANDHPNENVASLPSDHAQVRFSSIVSSAAVSRASIRGALNESALRRCYADALKRGSASQAPMTATLELQTNMAGRIENAAVTNPGLPKALTNCVEQVARSGRVREVDTGTARATVILEFQP